MFCPCSKNVVAAGVLLLFDFVCSRNSGRRSVCVKKKSVACWIVIIRCSVANQVVGGNYDEMDVFQSFNRSKVSLQVMRAGGCQNKGACLFCLKSSLFCREKGRKLSTAMEAQTGQQPGEGKTQSSMDVHSATRPRSLSLEHSSEKTEFCNSAIECKCRS